MASRKRSKSSAGVSSSSGPVTRWEQPCDLPDINDRLFRQDWRWEDYRNIFVAKRWNQNKQIEVRLWKWKMTNTANGVDEVLVCERLVNVEEFRAIGITQRFERLSWERVLDWCDGLTQRVYLIAVTKWLSTLRFENVREEPHLWRLVGETSQGRMVMSFETTNHIAHFDSLGYENYFYYPYHQFYTNKLVESDPSDLYARTLPKSDGSAANRKHLYLVGKILYNISLENVMVRLGDRGAVRAWDCRVLYSLLNGEPKLSWRHITMINIWESRESCSRKMIPNVRLISAMLMQQNCLPENSLWVDKPLENFDFMKMRTMSKITVQAMGNHYFVYDNLSNSFKYKEPTSGDEMEESDEEEEEEEDNDDENEVPARRAPPRVRRSRGSNHREIYGEVAGFVVNRRLPAHSNYNRGQQDTYDNVSAVLGEAKFREEERRARDDERWAQQQAQWALQEERWAQQQTWEAQREAHRLEAVALEDARWRALATAQEMHVNNSYIPHEQERHHRDLEAGRSYQQFVPWTNYETIRDQPPEVQASVHWPQGVASSFVPMPMPPSVEGGSPLDSFNEMMALTQYPYQPYPLRDPNEHYQR